MIRGLICSEVREAALVEGRVTCFASDRFVGDVGFALATDRDLREQQTRKIEVAQDRTI